jgi:hypothetical protein
MTPVIPITRARTRPISRCTRFTTARSRLQQLRPCFGTPAHIAAFVEVCRAARDERRNVVDLRTGRAWR